MKIATQPSRDISLDNTIYYYPNIRSSSTPKTLESYLFHHSNYQMLVHPGKINPYTLMKNEIEDQLKRLKEKKDPASQKKYKELLTNFKGITQQFESENEKSNDLQKAVKLLSELTPYLRIKTGYNRELPARLR